MFLQFNVGDVVRFNDDAKRILSDIDNETHTITHVKYLNSYGTPENTVGYFILDGNKSYSAVWLEKA